MRLLFTFIWIAIAVLALAAMWWGWRSRARRDAGVLGAVNALSSEILADFTSLQYVSTTPVGEPLSRVAAPGLRYRGPAEVVVRRDGVTIEVAGEQPVHLAAERLIGSGTASRRVGKAVESGGLALLRWRDGERELESSFRLPGSAEQQRFAEAVDRVASGVETDGKTSSSASTSQEDAQ